MKTKHLHHLASSKCAYGMSLQSEINKNCSAIFKKMSIFTMNRRLQKVREMHRSIAKC